MEVLALYKELHKLLHSKEEYLIAEGRKYTVETSRGLRYVRAGNDILAQQDLHEKTPVGLCSKAEPITRIVRAGKGWGWISNSEIIDPKA